MKTLFRATLYFCLFSLFVLSFTSCDKNSDLVEEYVLSDNLHEEKFDDQVASDLSEKNTTTAPDVSANDIDKD